MNKEIQKYDVIVVGSGVAGCTAALQAARAGAKTLLVEKNGMSGGNMTVCGVSFPGLFHAWGKQVISGIGWELVNQSMIECGRALPDFSNYDNIPHWLLQVRINPFVYACLLDEAFTNAGVDVLYHAMPVEAEEHDDCVSISIACKEGVNEYQCSVAIDASGDADLVKKAGFAVAENKEKQPATPMVKLSGYNFEDLDTVLIENAYNEAVKKGELNHLDYMSRPIKHLLQCHGDNSIHVVADKASTSEDRSDVEQRARAIVLKIYRFLRRLPGLENLKIEYLSSQCGIRETATIVGETVITAEDYATGKVWDDSLCYSFYPIDLHQREEHSGLLKKELEHGIVPTIPRSALIPKGSKRLLAAGRILSSDQLANSGLRVQASCMAMGQVAGALGALSSQKNQSPSELSIHEVKDLLVEHNAIVP